MDINEMRWNLRNEYNNNANIRKDVIDIIEIFKNENLNVLDFIVMFDMIASQLSDEEINIISNFFPLRTALDLCEKSGDLIEIKVLLIWISKMFSGYNFINQFKKVYNNDDISFLINCLQFDDVRTNSLLIIGTIIENDHSFVTFFFENGFLDQISQLDIDLSLSNMIVFLSKIEMLDNDFSLFFNFLLKVIFNLLQTQDCDILSNGLEIVFQLCYLKTSLFKTKGENLKLQCQYILDECLGFILQNISNFFNITPNKVIYLLKVLLFIEVLPSEIFKKLFSIIESFKNKTNEYDTQVLFTIAQILIHQYSNWKEIIDTDELFSIFFMILGNNSLKLRDESKILETLLRYSDFKHIQIPEMINLMIKYITYPNLSLQCLRAFNVLLSSCDSIPSLFGDQFEFFFSALNEVADCEDETRSLEAQNIINILKNKTL